MTSNLLQFCKGAESHGLEMKKIVTLQATELK